MIERSLTALQTLAYAFATDSSAKLGVMTTAEVMSTLEGLRDEGTFKQNAKRGVGDDQIGVKMGDLRTLAKKIKTNHELGLQLWDHGQHEAMHLAVLIMNPKKLDAAQIDCMARKIRSGHVADWFSAYLLKGHPACEELRAKWMDDSDPVIQRLGWSLMTRLVGKDTKAADPVVLLDRIEAEMGMKPEMAQWNMNFCLIEIGLRHPEHRDRAIKIGEAVGAFRDFPCSKGCVSPFAPIAIPEMVRRGY